MIFFCRSLLRAAALICCLHDSTCYPSVYPLLTLFYAFLSCYFWFLVFFIHASLLAWAARQWNHILNFSKAFMKSNFDIVLKILPNFTSKYIFYLLRLYVSMLSISYAQIVTSLRLCHQVLLHNLLKNILLLFKF